MPQPATSRTADARVDATGLADAHSRPAGSDAVYDIDIEVLRGCRRPLARHADEDRRTAGRRGAR